MSTPSLYPYQQEVFDHLLNGRNVILQAPTGAGKTHAALLPFLEALTQPGRTIAFPQKCIYAVPMRILANQFVTKYAPLFAKQRVSGWAPDLPAIAQQTGEHPDDPEFAARLTFATIDQVLSSFLVASYGLSSRQANINAGAVIASYLVLDEFHLFDPTSTLPTALEMLRLLRGLTPFTLMTATFSTGMLQRLATLLDAVIVGGTGYADQWRALPSQQKQRRYHTVDAPLSAARILEVHQSLATKRSLVICNRVERAQGLFAALRQAAPPDTELYLLHSRFLPEDRARIEAHITQYFSQNADKRGSVIVVATQAIEVGLDITSAALHTELAPANAIIQRAGRCARYRGEEGAVYLYRQSTAPDGSIANLFEDMSPYARRAANPTADGAAEDDNPHDNASENVLKRTMIEKTWEAFCARQGVLDYADELAIIDHAHQDLDQFTLDKLEAEQWAHRGTMFEAMNGGTEQVPGLVRDSNNRRVIIHNDPNALMTSGVVEATGPHTASEKKERTVSPYSLSAFNLYDGTARGFVKQWLERPLDEEPPHRLWALHEVEDPESQQRSYVWKHVTDASQVKSSALVCVSPMLAGYDPKQGFLPDEGNGWMTPPAPETAKRGDFGNYALETYAAHIERVYAELVEATFPEIAAAASKLEPQMGLRAGSIYLAARLAAVLHDTGKLSVGWQRFVHEWQQEIGEMADLDPHQAYAHTDNYTADHRKREKEFRKKVKRPNHAVEGAAATFYLMFGHLLGFQPTASKANGHNLVIAVYSAISRHHSPQVRGDFKPFNFVQKADSHTRQVMRDHMPELPDNAITLSTDEQQKQLATSASLKLDMNTKTYRTYFAYLLLVRALRRADQRGTRRGTRGK